MSFREKSAWISLGIYIAVYGYYFFTIAAAAAAGQSATFPFARLLGQVLWVLLIAEIALQAAAGAMKPKEANAPRDERERLILLKSTRWAFYIVMIGAATGAGTVAYGLPPFYTANGIFLAVVLAQVVKFASEAVHLRIGA